MTDDDLIEVELFETEAEAMEAASVLGSEGMEPVLKQEERAAAATDGADGGGTRLLVARPDAARARGLLSEWRLEEEILSSRQWSHVPAYRIERGLAVLRRRRLQHRLIVLLAVPVAGVAAVLTRASEEAAAVILLEIGLLALSAIRVTLTPCPRCEGRFHPWGLLSHAGTDRCLRCGLEL